MLHVQVVSELQLYVQQKALHEPEIPTGIDDSYNAAGEERLSLVCLLYINMSPG